MASSMRSSAAVERRVGVRLRGAVSEVRIVIIESPAAALSAAAALKRLGREARLEIHHGVDAGIARGRSPEVDVVVVDLALGDACGCIVDALRGEGPPVLVVGQELDDEAALEWFRRGAADCVALRSESDEALPLAALEQIRRWRVLRERGAAERRIRDLERYNENVIQNMNTAVLVVNPEGYITSCNAPAAQILGQPAAELIEQSANDWFQDGSGEGMIARTLAEGMRFKGAESVIVRADGSVVPIGISCAPISGAGGVACGAVATFQDLTGIRQLQRQVLQTEKMASIGQLAAGVAHEINNPTGFIHANLFQMAEYISDLRRLWLQVERLQKCVAQGGAEEVRRASEELAALSEEVDVDFLLSDLTKAIRESQEGSERIRHIVHDLRDFSHRDTGERVLADVNQCLDSTANIVWPMMKHLVVLEKEYQDVPSVTCYPMQLKQVIMNLLVNAYQAIEEKLGGGSETGRIHLRTEYRGEHVVISVADTGAGIAPECLDRIFDPFFTTKKVGAGTGLGLSTSYNIVQRHGGTIRVESTLREGTTFRVLLPVDGDDDAA
jgi:PAS domain S-box-containing protein